jgi:hypothetical protein
VLIKDEDEMKFGAGNDGSVISLPDPRICNLHLAIARVFSASGFAEVYDKYYRDHGEIEVEFVKEVSRRLLLSVMG